MLSSGGEETSLRGVCLALRSATLEKQRASRSPGFSGNIPSGIGRQPLSKFRTQPEIGWGKYTAGLKDKGRPVETLQGKGSPGPSQYKLDRLTYGQQVQSRFRTAPTPLFGSSQRPPLNASGISSPGPMTAVARLGVLPPGPKYSITGAPWRKEGSLDKSTPGPGQYNVSSALGEQTESTRTSFKGFVFGGAGIVRDMALPSKYVPGPGHYAWHKTDLLIQPGTKFGSAAQRPGPGKDTGPGPNQYSIPSTLGATMDSRFRNVVAPGFGPLPKAARSRTAAAYWGVGSGGPGPGQYDVNGRVNPSAWSSIPLGTGLISLIYIVTSPTSIADDGLREGKREELDPEKIKRAVKLTKKGCRVPDISFGCGPQRPVEKMGDYPGPQTYDPANLRRGMSASRSSSLREFKFGTGPQRHNTFETDKSPGPNADYKIPSTMGPQMNSMFKSVNAPSFASVSREELSKKGARDEPGPSTYCPTFSNLSQTTYVVSFGGGSTRGDGGRRDISPGPGAYKLDSALGPQTSSKYKSSPAPSLRAR
ncbi:unnamed protein product [Ascophyllum nodosum]